MGEVHTEFNFFFKFWKNLYWYEIKTYFLKNLFLSYFFLVKTPLKSFFVRIRPNSTGGGAFHWQTHSNKFFENFFPPSDFKIILTSIFLLYFQFHTGRNKLEWNRDWWLECDFKCVIRRGKGKVDRTISPVPALYNGLSFKMDVDVIVIERYRSYNSKKHPRRFQRGEPSFLSIIHKFYG